MSNKVSPIIYKTEMKMKQLISNTNNGKLK